jgi:hypothetical protein
VEFEAARTWSQERGHAVGDFEIWWKDFLACGYYLLRRDGWTCAIALMDGVMTYWHTKLNKHER